MEVTNGHHADAPTGGRSRGPGTSPEGPAGRRPPGRPSLVPPRPHAGSAAGLLRLAEAFVRLFLEVECGTRDRHQLAPLLDEVLFARLEQAWVRPGPSGHLVRIGGVHTGPATYDAVAIVQRGRRAGAVAVRLTQHAGRWRVTDIARPEDGPLPPPPYPLPLDEPDSFDLVLG